MSDGAQYRFGPFEVRPFSRELRKNGVRIKLRDQPFRILVYLLERPSELVTRDELVRLLWPDGTLVDFDKGLNTAVNSLREALRDSAAQPRYIETVPKYGYRFIATVERHEPRPAIPDDVTDTGAAISSKSRAARRWVIAGSTVTVVCAAVLVFRAWFEPPLSARGMYPSPLTTYPGVEQSPSFSPDAAHIAFAWRNQDALDFDIYVQSIGSATALRITDSAADEFSPAWSPDGSVLAFLRQIAPQRFEILIVPSLGGSPRKLTEAVMSFDADPLPLLTQRDQLTWTPDSRGLLFPDAVADDRTAIWRIELAGNTRTQLTRPVTGTRHVLPRLSPDGRHLAYQQQGGEHSHQIFTLALDETGQAAAKPALRAHGLRTAPVGWLGNELLFIKGSDNAADLHLWSARRPEEALIVPRIAGLSDRLGLPALSRDGRRIAVPVYHMDCDLWQMELSPDGEAANPTPLVTSTECDLGPDFSPDGRQLLFKSTRTGYGEAWVSNADGSGARQLTNAKGLGVARWAPDGHTIVFNRGEGGNEDLYLADAETGAIRQITHDRSMDQDATWSRDGRWIYYTSNRTGRNEVWKTPVPGGQAVQITSNGGQNPFESPDGKHLYYGKTSALGSYVWRMPLDGGPEERLFKARVDWASLAMGRNRMYFVRDRSLTAAAYGTIIYSYDLVTNQVRRVAEPGPEILTLAPSPDERRIVYGAFSIAGADIILLDRPGR